MKLLHRFVQPNQWIETFPFPTTLNINSWYTRDKSRNQLETWDYGNSIKNEMLKTRRTLLNHCNSHVQNPPQK